MHRRQFIGTAIASAGAWLVAPADASSIDRATRANPAATSHALDFAFYDERYPDAIRFAAVMAHAGTATLAVRGEIVTLWRDCIRITPRGHRPRIAAITLFSDFQILAGLGAERGLRVLHQGRHVRDPRGGMVHHLACGLEATQAAACRSDSWPEHLARALIDEAPADTWRATDTAIHNGPTQIFRAGTLASCLLG